MVKRYCPKCNAQFDRKSNYEKHMKKKFDCITIKYIANEEKNDETMLCRFVQKSCENMQDINNEQKIMQDNIENISEITNTIFCCSYCKKNYSSKSTLTRHIKENCKIKKESEK